MDVIVVASYIWLCCSCVCFLKIVTRRPPTAIIPFRHAGNIFPCLSLWLPLSTQPSFPVSGFKGNTQVLWKAQMLANTMAALSQGDFFIWSHLHFTSSCSLSGSFLFTKRHGFPDSSFPPFLLPLDVKKSLPTSSDGQCSLLFCVTRASEQAFPSDCSRCLINPVCRGVWGKTFFFLFMKHLPWNLLSLGENLGNIVFFFIQKSSQWAVGKF